MATVTQKRNDDVGRNISQRKIRIGIVGCGEVTQIMHWPSLQQLADCYEVVALCDISPLVLEYLGKQWNVGILTTDHRELVNRDEDIRFARVRDFLGSNSLIIEPTSRVVRDEHLSDSLKEEAEIRDRNLVDEALGGRPSESLRNAYRLMLGLSSHDLSAMRELLGKPKRVLFAAERANGRYLAAAFDYGTYVCQFETGIDEIARFDAHLEVYSAKRVVRVQYDTPYVRNMPTRVFILGSYDRHGVREISTHPAWGDSFVAEWIAFHANITQGRTPKSDPSDFLQDLELFAEMARLMRE